MYNLFLRIVKLTILLGYYYTKRNIIIDFKNIGVCCNIRNIPQAFLIKNKQ